MTPPELAPRSSVSGQRTVAAALVVFTACGVAAALLAAKLLTSVEYTVFAAFSGIFGILVLAPASSLEQSSVLRGASGTAALRTMLRKAAGVGLVVTAIVSVPVGDWQHRLLGAWTGLAVTTLLLSTPIILVLAVLRGLALGRQHLRLVAVSYVAAGLGTLLLPPTLYALGLRPLPAFLIGTTFAWVPALALISAAPRGMSRRQPARPFVEGDDRTSWLILANILVVANLLAVPPLLRWHVGALGADLAADLQLLVSMSRLSTTLVLAFLPLLIAQLRTRPSVTGMGAAYGALAASTCLGGGAVVASAALGNLIIRLLTARDASASLSVIVLATLPAILLCPAVTLMGVAVVRRQYRLATAAWSSGVLVLASTGAIDFADRGNGVLVGVLLSAALPLVILLFGLREAERRVPQ